MTTPRELFRQAELTARSSGRRDLVNQSSPPCDHAAPSGASPCCGPTYRCENTDSENVNRLGTAGRCRRCADAVLVHPPADARLLSVVIPVIDEDPEDLATTLLTIHEGTDGPVEFIIVDDASKEALELPILEGTIYPRPHPVHLVRNLKRMGATRSREAGAHLADGTYVAILDSHMKIAPGNLRRLAALASKTHGIAYCGCNNHLACQLAMVDGLPVAKWKTVRRGQKTPLLTDSMMGACYVMERTVLERMGGWIGLPGFLGSQELAMSLMAWKCDVPITCDPSIQNWHRFRRNPSAPVPFDGYLLNRVIILRWLFEDPAWEIWKERLQARPWRTRNDRAIPASLIAEAEDPRYQAYGKARRDRMTRTDDEMMEYLTWIQKGRKDGHQPAR